MEHNISAIILKGKFNEEEAKKYDLIGIDLGQELTMFHVDLSFTAYWQIKLKTKGFLDNNCCNYRFYPAEYSISELMTRISLTEIPVFAVIATEFINGNGVSVGNVYKKDKIADSSVKTINGALAFLGVVNAPGQDEFETVGLLDHRSTPDYIEKYFDMIEKLGL